MTGLRTRAIGNATAMKIQSLPSSLSSEQDRGHRLGWSISFPAIPSIQSARSRYRTRSIRDQTRLRRNVGGGGDNNRRRRAVSLVGRQRSRRRRLAAGAWEGVVSTGRSADCQPSTRRTSRGSKEWTSRRRRRLRARNNCRRKITED